MGSVSINYWAVLVAAVAYMLLGAIWYSKGLFGKTWMQKIGKTEEQVKADFSAIYYLYSLIGAFIAAYGIARIMIWMGDVSITAGIKVGLVAGVCFVLATFCVNDMYEKRPTALSVINILYHIVGFIIAGIIIGVWH